MSTRPATDSGEDASWDVAIVGGGLAGSAMALLLLRRMPGLRVLMIERSRVFGRRVGEATVEVSTYFLGKVLGLTRHLNEAHLAKQGMRFWFGDAATRGLGDAGEIGTRYLVRLPAYQVDRAVLDAEALDQACAAGAVCWRPAVVHQVELKGSHGQHLTVTHEGTRRSIHARWVVDASGVAALLARQEGWFEVNDSHPTSAAWARWEGVGDWDGIELAAQHPEWARACPGIRGTATNHFMGDGWWAWCIPLKGGDVSVGVVFDERRQTWPAEGTVAERLKGFLDRHPVARELLAGARPRDGDVHWRRRLAYRCRVQAGDGFVLVGDAAGFIDPLYSPGLDWLTYTVCAGARLVESGLRGAALAEPLARHNAAFTRSHRQWFEAVYENKYAYLGDFELMRLAFLLDLGLYYLGVVSQPLRRGDVALVEPIFSTRPSGPVFRLMRTYNRRFAAMADERRRTGRFGRRNRGSRFLFGGYTIEPSSLRPLLGALLGWMRLELREGWRTWGRRAVQPTVTGSVAAVPAAARETSRGVPA
ncbi:MAG: NAD(P)/FAD-dependent oxidoreductase [Verrucomicrobiae bacterium]|nr:NAD(P)/FAD-dependent oxidoreductase [Verrucomicrobiae bacterium]